MDKHIVDNSNDTVDKQLSKNPTDGILDVVWLAISDSWTTDMNLIIASCFLRISSFLHCDHY